MKKYLMTWYGITDFRASLGQEKTTGPVLGALLSEDYTDVVILGFTNPDKSENNADEFQSQVAFLREDETVKRELIDLFPDTSDGRDMATHLYEEQCQLAQRNFVPKFSNTSVAHAHFIQWLEKELRDTEPKVNLHFHSVDLKYLNDTEGIYEAATSALNTVATTEGDKLVTLYLSPGTPVMAFVWAFAALRHPNLKKRLIASSQPGKPPEKVVLPNEWLEWHGRQILTTNGECDQYDVIFHLFGEQRMPNLQGVIQFSSRKHIFVNSAEFPAYVMKQFLGEAEYGEVAVDPYDPENIRSTILDLIAKMPANIRIGFNLTGGTKLMYAGALAACRKVNATPFYFNSRNNKVIYLNNFKSVDTKLISSVETFIKLNGNNLFISKEGHWTDIPDRENPDRVALTKELWTLRFVISGLYKRLADKYNDKPGQDFQLTHRDKRSNTKISVSLKEGHLAEIRMKYRNGKENTYCFQNWPDFARYLSGGWFEEYTFMKLQPFVNAGLIKDIRIGLEVSFKEDDTDKKSLSFGAQLNNLFGNTYQELDVIFTDGRRLYVIECKAGKYHKGEYVRKLESITRYFGGIEGQGLLACCFSPTSSVVKQKATEAHNIRLMAGQYLFDELDSLFIQ